MIPSFFDDSDLISCKLNKGTDLATRPSRKKRFATSRIELGTVSSWLSRTFMI